MSLSGSFNESLVKQCFYCVKYPYLILTSAMRWREQTSTTNSSILKEIFLLVPWACVDCACATAVVPVYSSYFIWLSVSKHRRETICRFVYFKMAYANNDGLSLALDRFI